uniref:Transcriptional regulator LacI/GalR-like sensor domain-containing protein n=1 Tax=Siphoviridae sp. ctBLh2 TaxID=2827803 RepID=A0A8S5S2K1_9CAUD|nr:MAG TPA: hypothetical protein [Siphoviridae sp. ctBLh2]
MARILFLTDFSEAYARNLLLGIARYAHAVGQAWSLCRLPLSIRDKFGIEAVIDLAKKMRADAVIGQFYNTDNVELFARNGIITIAQDFKARFTTIPNITGPHFLAGKMGAEYFAKKGFRHFAFYGTRDVVWSDERMQGFRETVRAANPSFTFSALCKNTQNALWDYDTNQLVTWLQSLPKPVAIMACDDNHAYHITEACQQGEGGGSAAHPRRHRGAGRRQRRDDLPSLLAQPLVAQPEHRTGRLRRRPVDRPHPPRPGHPARGRHGPADAHRHAPIDRHLRQQRPAHRRGAEVHPREHQPEDHGGRAGRAGTALAPAARDPFQTEHGHVDLRLHPPDPHREGRPAAVRGHERLRSSHRAGLLGYQEPLTDVPATAGHDPLGVPPRDPPPETLNPAHAVHTSRAQRTGMKNEGPHLQVRPLAVVGRAVRNRFRNHSSMKSMLISRWNTSCSEMEVSVVARPWMWRMLSKIVRMRCSLSTQ